MRDIRIEKGINKGNALLLCEWSNEQGKEFQEQWMGSEISYPLDYDKIKDLGNVFSIFNQGEFIGMIQEVRPLQNLTPSSIILVFEHYWLTRSQYF